MKPKHFSWMFWTMVVTVTAFFLLAMQVIKKQYPGTTTTVSKHISDQTDFSEPDNKNPKDTEKQFFLPSTYLLDVPFTPQAPTANWDDLHNEACEEASSIMAMVYFNMKGQTDKYDKNSDDIIDPEFVEKEITKLTDWQEQNFGYHLDINATETAQMVEENYGLKAEIKNNFSAIDIKKALTEDKLVLFPANGQMLENPNFRRPGPPYHMVVIRGYSSMGFVTNDPGTRNGRNYTYTFDTLYVANGDWQHSTNSVDTSKKLIIVVSKN